MKLLEIKNLSINNINNDYSKSIVKNLNFEVDKGQTVALIGQSGSGKTLTALAIMGLLPAGFQATGQIIFNRKNLLHLKEVERRQFRGNEIAYTLQNFGSLNPCLNIKKQLVEPTLSLSLTEIESLLDQLGLGKKILKQYPHQLSGGMRQRVLLAIALAARPKILIADEPTNGLDTTIAQQILDLLDQQGKKNNLGLLLISHDLAIVAQVADFIVILKDGQIIEQGLTKDIFNKASHSYTKELLESARKLNYEFAAG